jgi:hypothetical protein
MQINNIAAANSSHLVGFPVRWGTSLTVLSVISPSLVSFFHKF